MRQTQCMMILKELRKGRSLTVMDAVNMGIYALSQRCGDLKRQGHAVYSYPIRVPSGKRVACYRLAGARKFCHD